MLLLVLVTRWLSSRIELAPSTRSRFGMPAGADREGDKKSPAFHALTGAHQKN